MDSPPPVAVSPPKQYVRADGPTLRVGPTRQSLDVVVVAHRAGDSPEAIRRDFPGLSLEEIYGAITYYLANRGAVDAYLADRERGAAEVRRRIEAMPTPPVVERLRALRRARVAGAVDGSPVAGRPVGAAR